MAHTVHETLRDAVARFPAPARHTIADIVLNDAFAAVIEAHEAAQLAASMACSPEQLMHALVDIARCFSLPPISHYRAGAVIRDGEGHLYLGANLEFPGLALNASVHGEQAAVVNAVLHGAESLTAIAVGGTPCGHCRQFLLEFGQPEFGFIQADGSSTPLTVLLPEAFGPAKLGHKGSPLAPSVPRLELEGAVEGDLITAAAALAHRSYAPYTKNWSAVALRAGSDRVFAAPYLESVAFNPSLSPLQGALVAMRLNGAAWADIDEALLLETKGAASSHEAATRALLATLTPTPLRVIRARPLG